jgi:type II secretory pathway pseudopilin PulG
MIVVAIIGLLASMAIPHFARSRVEAHRVSCLNNLRQIEGAVQLWALETKKEGEQAVTYADISGYLRNAVVCPAGGTSFEDSYTVATIDTRPVCQRRPETHHL